MRVWVVVCDSGLNGAWCDSAWSTQKAAEQRTAEVNRSGYKPTGWTGASVETHTIDEVDPEEATR